jgi:uncharacterized protein
MKVIVSLISLCFLLISFSCRDKKKNEETSDVFDKQKMLQNYSENLIIPIYDSLNKAIEDLSLNFNAFKNNKNQETLSLLKQSYLKTYLAYQSASIFELGPAETVQLRLNSNVFPTDSLQIKSNINGGGYDLQAAVNLDAKGLPALDYLLYSKDDSLILAELKTNNILSNNTIKYLEALILDLKLKYNKVGSDWTNYQINFNKSLDASIGSSLGQLVNQLSFELENIKNLKLGIPLGKKTLGNPQASKSEALYSRKSVILLIKNLEQIENVYLGRSTNNLNGQGLDDYIIALKANYNGGLLDDAIKNQFTSIKQKLNFINKPISIAVLEQNTDLNQLYLEIQKMVVLLKVDLPSALGVIITYQDGDGD